MSENKNNINLFFVIHDFSGAKTYSDELNNYLCTLREIKIHIIHIESISHKEFTITEKEGRTHIYIPQKNKEQSMNIPKFNHNVCLLLYLSWKNLNNVILHCNAQEHYYLAKEFKDRFKCPVICTVHFLPDYLTYFEKKKLNTNEVNISGDALFRLMIDLVDQIICVTKFSQQILHKYYKITEEKMTLIYNGMSLPEYKPNVYIRDLRISYGFDPGDILILYAGRIEAAKGITELINAFLLIRDKIKDSKLILAGTGNFNEFMAISQKYPGKIIFVGSLEKNVLLDFYKFCDIGVLPSRFEQCSYVVIEMMLMRLPIIISDIPGLNEMITHNENGLICKTTNINEKLEIDKIDLSIQLENMILSRNREVFEIKAQQFAQIHFNSRLMGTKTCQIYHQLLNSQNKL